jgi:hypothetical protein
MTANDSQDHLSLPRRQLIKSPLDDAANCLFVAAAPHHDARLARPRPTVARNQSALPKIDRTCFHRAHTGWGAPELNTSVFIILGEHIKNGEERLVVPSRVAKSVVESVRGLHPNYVFVLAHNKEGEPKPVTKINNTAWKAARERAAGVSFEDRQDLLGHRSGRITTHYSQAELTSLIEAAERVCDTESRKSPAITWLRRKSG